MRIIVVNLQDNWAVFRIFFPHFEGFLSPDSPSYNFTRDKRIGSEGSEAYFPLKEPSKEKQKTTHFDKLLHSPQYTARVSPQCKIFKMAYVLPYNVIHLIMFRKGMMPRN